MQNGNSNVLHYSIKSKSRGTVNTTHIIIYYI